MQDHKNFDVIKFVPMHDFELVHLHDDFHLEHAQGRSKQNEIKKSNNNKMTY